MSLGSAAVETVGGTWWSCYRVPGTEHRVVVTTPHGDPQVWGDYLAGLREAYEFYGVGSAQRVDESRTSLVFVLYTPAGRAIAGGRTLVPLRHAEESDTLAIFQGARAAHTEVVTRMGDGVFDMEGVWIARDAPDRPAVAAAVQRIPVHGAALLGVRWGLGAAAEHSLRLWRSGGVAVLDVPPVVYPDDRYLTRFIVWDRRQWPGRVGPEQRWAMRLELAELDTDLQVDFLDEEQEAS